MQKLKIELSVNGPVMLVTLRNPFPYTLKLLKWNSILDAPYAHGFTVLKNGISVPYIGPEYCRMFDASESLLSMPATSTIQIEFNLEKVINNFEFNEVASGDNITIAPASYILQVLDDQAPLTETGDYSFTDVETEVDEMRIDSNLVLKLYKKRDGFDIETIDNDEMIDIPLCSKGHNSLFVQVGPIENRGIGYPVTSGFNTNEITAIRKLVKLVFDKKNTVLKSVTNTATYKKWFGPFNTAGKTKVEAVLKEIHRGECPGYLVNRAAPGTYTSDTLAYIIHNPSYNQGYQRCTAAQHFCHQMYLCPRFWQLPEKGVNSRVGVFIHELTHSYTYTKDIKYGRADCQTLAKNKPADALNNADSYRFYCEDSIG